MISERRKRGQPVLLTFVGLVLAAGGTIMTFLGVSSRPVMWSYALPGLVMVLSGLVEIRIAWRQWLEVRPLPPGQCRCGYNLAGNVSGACPECGREVGSSPDERAS